MKTKLQTFRKVSGGLPSFALLAGLLLAGPSAFAQFPGFGGRGGNNGGGSAPSGGLQAATQVTAVADEYSNSLIILAPENYLQAITNLIEKLDVAVQDVTEVRVFALRNADPTEMATVLSQLFPDDSSSNNNNNRGPGFFFRGRNGNNGGSTTESERAKKQTKVLAVADPRTSSVIVTASHDLMDQIAPMIAQLDASTAKKQKVYVYSLENAEATDVETVLKSLFETTNSRNGRSGTQTSQQNNALTQRQNNAARNQGSTTSTGFGSSGGLGTTGLGGTGR